MAALMQREGIRHIHAHYATHPALAAWIISRLTGITYSITVHAHDIFVRTAMLATKLRSAAFVVAISEYNREYLVRRLGTWVDEKIIVIHCGIRPELYPQRAHSDTPNERASAPFQIIHVGSLQAYKGQQYLIKACALLRQRAIPFYCKIVGSGEELQRLQRLVQEEGLQEWITFMGARTQQEVAQLLSHADCYVQPSIVTSAGKMEGIPVALMEAMAAGVPCIATQISGIPELIRHQVTGWLVVPKDVQGLADCLDVVYRDPVGAAQVARAGRHVVLDQFDLSANVHQLAARMAPMVQE
jgi:glycosyltransferase involved in cell wall biosynthesis